MRRSRRQLFSTGRKKRPGCLILPALLLVLLFLVLLLNQINNRRAIVHRVEVSVPGLARVLEGFSILHLSDLHAVHFGAEQEILRTLLEKENFQVVCMTGDMVGRSGDAGPLIDLIEILPEGIPVFFIAGDNDPSPLVSTPHGDSSVKAPYISLAEEHGAIYLDSPQRVEYRDVNLWFCPELLLSIDLEAAHFSALARQEELLASEEIYSPETGALLRMMQYQLESLERTFAARQEMQADDLLVLLSHFPPSAQDALGFTGRSGFAASSSRFPGQVALMLSGHYNNGQWRFPGLGPLFVPSTPSRQEGWFPGDEGIAGLSMLSGIPLYVSPGLGSSGAYPWQPGRLFNTPVVTILSLTGRIG